MNEFWNENLDIRFTSPIAFINSTEVKNLINEQFFKHTLVGVLQKVSLKILG